MYIYLICKSPQLAIDASVLSLGKYLQNKALEFVEFNQNVSSFEFIFIFIKMLVIRSNWSSMQI